VHYANRTIASRLLAAANGRINILELLLGSGRIETVQAQDKQGLSALHWAARNGRNNVVKVLVEYGADIDVRNKEGQSPLHTAVVAKRPDTVGVLLDFGADPLAVTKEGASAIDLAVRDGLVDILHLLENAVEEEEGEDYAMVG